MLDKISNINIFGFLDNLILIGGYLVLVLGIWIIFSDNIIKIFRYKKNKLKRGSKQTKDSVIEDFRTHIKLVLYITYNSKNLSLYYTFIIISIMLAVGTFVVVKRQSTYVFTVFFSICSSLLPYLYLRLKLRSIRVEGSHEAEGLITELINQYKINYFNMIEAIDKAIPFLSGYPHTQSMIFRLSSRIKEYRNEQELEKILKEFTYSLDTQWGIMLANNISFAISDGTVVTAALEDILKDLRDSRNDAEIAKRLNNEGFAMMKYLSPLLYLASIYVAVQIFGFTLKKFILYQLNTPLGFKFFVYIAFASIINFSVILYFKKQKFDL